MDNKKKQNKKEKFEAPVSTMEQQDANRKIYTMPEKFLVTQKGSAMSKKMLITIIAVVVAIVIVVAGYFIYQSMTSTTPVVVLNSNLNKSVSNLNNNSNSNSNQNVNSNSNQNSNTNANTNSSSNSNSNQNTNQGLSFNANFSRNTNVNQNINFDFGIVTTLSDSLDTDNDGLTDEEEKMFGTDEDLPDTDEDGFLDGEEVENAYYPLGEGLIQDSELVSKYENETFNYSIYYPTDWQAQALTEGESEALFTSASGEFVEVLVVDNPNLFSAKSWYLNQFPKASSAQLKSVTIGGQSGIKSIDGYSYYISKQDQIFILHHNVGVQAESDFRTTFLMMAATFLFGK